jgi:hypothetical protein
MKGTSRCRGDYCSTTRIGGSRLPDPSAGNRVDSACDEVHPYMASTVERQTHHEAITGCG